MRADLISEGVISSILVHTSFASEIFNPDDEESKSFQLSSLKDLNIID